MATESEFIDSLFSSNPKTPTDGGSDRSDGAVVTLLPVLSAMDKTLDEIAANTSVLSTLKFWQKTALKVQQKTQNQGKNKKTAASAAGGVGFTQTPTGTGSHTKINIATALPKTRQATTRTATEKTKPNNKKTAEADLLSPARTSKTKKAGKDASAASPLITAADAIQKASQNIAKQTSLAVKQAKKEATGQKVKTKSSEALEKSASKNGGNSQENTGLLSEIKNRLKDWNGDFLGDGHEKELEDAVGYGVGGPLYGAMKEVKGAIDDIDIDDNSLAGTIKNAIADKVGITAAKDKVAGAKENLKAGIMKWAGLDQLAEKNNNGNRDEHGRFIKGGKKQDKAPVAEPAEAKKKNIISEKDPLGDAINTQTETEQDSLNLQEKEAKNADKRHKQVLRALGSAGGGGIGGMAGDLVGNLFGKGKGKGIFGKALGKGKGFFGKIAGKIGGKALGVGLGAGAVGAGTLAAGAGTTAATAATTGATLAGDAGAVAGKTGAAVTEKAGGKVGAVAAEKVGGKAGAAVAEKAGGKGLAKLGAKVAAKGAGRAAYAIPVVGQALALGMTAYDAISGFNDKELHQQAFGLKEGEEATLGQKVSSSLANVVDMGGVVTGIASLFGADVNTADIAKGIYGFFGGDTDKNKKAATAEKAEGPAAEGTASAGQVAAAGAAGAGLAAGVGQIASAGQAAGIGQGTGIGATGAAVAGAAAAAIGAAQGKDAAGTTAAGTTADGTTATGTIATDGKTKAEAGIANKGESTSLLETISETAQGILKGLTDFFKDSDTAQQLQGVLGEFGTSISNGVSGAMTAIGNSVSSFTGGGKGPTAELKGDTSQVLSASLAMGTQDAVNRGVKYKFGSKNSKTGGIDCSGWVTENTLAMFDNVNKAAGKEIFGKDARKAITEGGGAAGIIQSVSEKTGVQLTNADITPDKIKAGMMIGMDTGNHGWDNGRYKGIDHIVQTYQDPETGQIMVSESSGKKGVHATPYEEWYKKWGKKANLYATDVTQLANKDALQPVEGQTPAEGTNAAPAMVASASTAQTAEKVGTIAPQTGTPQQQQQQAALKELSPALQTVATANATDTTNIEKLLTQILAAVVKNGANGEGGTGGSPQNIALTFNDPALNRMAAM